MLLSIRSISRALKAFEEQSSRFQQLAWLLPREKVLLHEPNFNAMR